MSALTNFLKTNKHSDSQLITELSNLLVSAKKSKAIDNKIEFHICELIKKNSGGVELSYVEEIAFRSEPADLIAAIGAPNHTNRKDSFRVKAVSIVENLIEMFERPIEEHEDWLSVYDQPLT